MALQFDAFSQSPATFTTATASWTHTPVGTPVAVIISVEHDAWAGAGWAMPTVTYGGVAVPNQPPQNTDSGTGVNDIFLLTSNIPAGPQTVQIVPNGGTLAKSAGCVTVSSDTGGRAMFDSAEGAGGAATTAPGGTVDHSGTLAAGWFGYWAGLMAVATSASGVVAGVTYAGGRSFGTSSAAYHYRTATASAASSAYGYTGIASGRFTSVGVVLRETAAPEVVATNGLNDAAAGTSHAVPLPAPSGGILANDIVLIVAGIDGTSAITPPDGTWNEILDASVGSTASARAAVYWKRMAGGETGTITFTTASEGGGWSSYCIRYAHTTEAPAISSVVNGAATANIGNPPSLNPAGWDTPEETLWLAGMVVDGNNTVTAAPANFTNLLVHRWANTGGASVATARRFTSAAAEDPGVFTHGAGQHGAFTIAVRPAAPVAAEPPRRRIMRPHRVAVHHAAT